MKSRSFANGTPTSLSKSGNAGAAINYKTPTKERNYNITVKGVITILIVDVVVTAANVAIFCPDKFEKAVKWLKGLSKHKEEENESRF